MRVADLPTPALVVDTGAFTRNLDTMSPVKRKQYLQALKIATRALAVRPADGRCRRLGDPNARTKSADGKAHAAETSPELAIEIEEP